MRSVKSKLLIVCIVLGLLGWLTSSPALGSVKWSQLPDQTPRGMDIRCDRNDGIDRVLADDFQCIKTARITDVHLWGSWKNDEKGNITQIHLSIHADIPANPPNPSMPGKVLWEKDFYDEDFRERLHRNLDPDYEWWWDPYTGDLTPAGDRQIWRYDIYIDPCDAFMQEGTRTDPIIYWLDVWVKTDGGQFGWKTSKKHWMDDAAYLDTAGAWQELRYPEEHPYSGKSIDMAFVITSSRPPVSPYVVIDTLDQWQQALLLDEGSGVIPINPAEDQWGDYMRAWSNPLEGEPYPSNTFVDPCLYAWPGSPCDDNLPSSPGVVMAWGNPQLEPGPYSSGWQYKYPRDPDLTDVMITVTVLPPCDPCISTVSFGMRDIFGNHRGWYWDVPATLPCGIANTITIDTSILGATAANPVADAYMSDVGFDITQVEALLFDENCIWVDEAVVPPPGTTIPRAWNYWYDLTVTPKLVKTIGWLKWSQPPREIHPGRFLGWDERSIRYQPPLMADDWHCRDQRAVTDIHWWGSHLGWTDSNEPPLMPIAFHFGIWTDVPRNPNIFNSFSHPGKMIWEHECSDYNWEFVAYDKDPRQPFGAPALAEDSCFQYYCDLPEDEWFYQEHDPNGHGTIYWLSIAAIYESGVDIIFPWGWKTRPHFFQDDAVRIETLEAGAAGWPPTVGSKWHSGEPVEHPEGVSWDLAFELTTNQEHPPPIVDHTGDWLVNWEDFAVFANWWLADLRQ